MTCADFCSTVERPDSAKVANPATVNLQVDNIGRLTEAGGGRPACPGLDTKCESYGQDKGFVPTPRQIREGAYDSYYDESASPSAGDLNPTIKKTETFPDRSAIYRPVIPDYDSYYDESVSPAAGDLNPTIKKQRRSLTGQQSIVPSRTKRATGSCFNWDWMCFGKATTKEHSSYLQRRLKLVPAILSAAIF